MLNFELAEINGERMRMFVCIALMILLFSCSSENQQSEGQGDNLISTEISSDKNQKDKLEAFLQGEWTQTENCDNDGNCQTILNSTWIFKSGEVQWNEFIHPCLIRNDTVYIGGTPYRVISELKDTIRFRAEGMHEFMKLIRK